MTRATALFVALTGVSVLSAVTPVQRPEDTAACADARFAPALDSIRSTMRENNTPSAAIAVAVQGRVVCEAAFGWADISKQIAATPSTMYSLASISKPFTATALMRLVEQKKVDLRRPANAYLGEGKLRAFEGTEQAATVERLLTHTAGLPLHYQFFYQGGPAVPAMDTAIGRYGVIVYPPGERFVYSNFGFGVLERIIERAAGGTYDDAMRRLLLEPLGLKATVVSDGAGLDGSRAALRYANDQQPIAPYTFDHVGASGVWSSARDLIRFGMFHLGHDTARATPPLSRATRVAMQQSVAPADAPGRARGLGWGIVESVDGTRQVSHTGSMPGVSTILTLYPEHDVAIVALTNISNSPATARLERALREAVLPRAESPTGTPEPRPADSGQQPATPPSFGSALGGHWGGTITLPTGETIAVELRVGDDNVVRMKVGSGADEPLAGARLTNNWLSGRLPTALIGPDAAPADRRMQNNSTISLAIRGNRLSGWVSSISTANPPYGAVSFPIRLTKQ